MRKILTILILMWFFVPVKAQTPLTTAVDFTVTDADGNTFNLFNTLNSNKYVLIDFFYSTWSSCGPNTVKVQYAYQYFGCNSSNVVVIGISHLDNNATIHAFDTQWQTLPGGKFSAAGTEGGGVAVKNAYGIPAFPTMILIAPNKNIVEQDIWPVANGAYLAGVIESNGGIPATCPPIGINEISNTSKTAFIHSYPNPANTEFNLQFNVEENASISFEVFNLLGEKILDIPSTLYSNGTHTIQIPVVNLSNGTYFVNLLSNNIKKDLTKLVIVK